MTYEQWSNGVQSYTNSGRSLHHQMPKNPSFSTIVDWGNDVIFACFAKLGFGDVDVAAVLRLFEAIKHKRCSRTGRRAFSCQHHWTRASAVFVGALSKKLAGISNVALSEIDGGLPLSRYDFDSLELHKYLNSTIKAKVSIFKILQRLADRT